MTIRTEPLNETERKAWAASIPQVEAIFALEGMYPDEQSKAIDAAILAGRVSPGQAIDELVEYAQAHKTVKGFIKSREWACK